MWIEKGVTAAWLSVLHRASKQNMYPGHVFLFLLVIRSDNDFYNHCFFLRVFRYIFM